MSAISSRVLRADWTFTEFAAKHPSAARHMAPRGTYRDYHALPTNGYPWCSLYGIQGFACDSERPVLLRGSRECMYSRYADLEPLMARMVRRTLAWGGLTIVHHDVAQRYLQRVRDRIAAHFRGYSSEYHFVRRIQDCLRLVLDGAYVDVGVERGTALFDDANVLPAPILLDGRIVTDLDVAAGRGRRSRAETVARFLRLLDKSSRADVAVLVDAERDACAERKRAVSDVNYFVRSATIRLAGR